MSNNISFLIYENPIYGVSIEYPLSWTYQEPQEEPSANTTLESLQIAECNLSKIFLNSNELMSNSKI